MKKIIALVLVFSFVISNMIVPVYASEADDVAVEFEILKQLGITDDAAELEAVVTRGEFAEYVGRMLNIASNYTDKRYFTDVAENSVINALTEIGVFKGTEEHLFEAEDEIVLTHACVALVRALGYRFETEGATINDYILMAKRLDITEGIDLTEEATGRVVLRMIYNTLTATVGEPTSYIKSGDAWEYYVSPTGNKTLIELVFNAYILEGQVTENCYTGLYDKSSIADDRIKIGTTEFKCEIEGAEALIGQNVIALVSFEDKDASLHSIMYITADEEKNETVVIDAEQIEAYDNYVLKYYNEAGRIREIRFLPSMALIYNGVAIDTNYRRYFSFDIGTVRCIKGNSDYYSIAIIEEVKNVTVKGVDFAEATIYTDGVAPYDVLDMSSDSGDYKKLYIDESGKSMGLQSLAHGDALSVIRSDDGNYIKIFLCSKSVEGTLSSVKGGNEAIYVIDGTEYKAAPDFDPLKNYNPGSKVKYILDITGKLAFDGKVSGTDDKLLGYMYKMAEIDEPFEKTVKFMIYTQNQEHIAVECADRVSFNDETVKKESLPAKLKKFDGSFKRSMILFKLNKAGKLSYIDTPAETKTEKEKTNSLWKVAEEDSYTYDDTHKMFRPYYATNNKTVVFAIPHENNANPSELAFAVYNDVSDAFVTYTDYSGVAMYKFSEDTPYIDVITYRRGDGLNTGISLYADVILVDEITQVLGSDGEAVDNIYGIERQKTVSYRVEPGLDISMVGSGDIIRVGRNARGYIASIELIYDLSEDSVAWGTGYESDVFGANKRYTLGYVDSIYIDNVGGDTTVKSLFCVSEVLGGELVEAHSWHTNNNNFTIYDTSRRTNKAYIGNISDILTYETAKGEASKIFVHFRGKNRMSWIFYK